MHHTEKEALNAVHLKISNLKFSNNNFCHAYILHKSFQIMINLDIFTQNILYVFSDSYRYTTI